MRLKIAAAALLLITGLLVAADATQPPRPLGATVGRSAAAAVAAPFGRAAAAAAPLPCPAVAAHRTGMLHAPENTVAGIAWAAGAGAAAVEMDVRFSSSDFPVLMHDPTVDRTTNGTGNVEDKTLGQLTALRVDNYPPDTTEHVPYGWDVMNALAGHNINGILEVLSPASLTKPQMDKLVYYINLFGWAERTVLMGAPGQVALMHGWYPTLHYMVIEYPQQPVAQFIRVGPYVVAQGAEAYATFITAIRRPYVNLWKADGLAVYTWTSDTPAVDVAANWAKAADAGADVLITNETTDVITWKAAYCA